MPSLSEALRSPELLHRASSRLLIVDVQEKLVVALSESTRERLVANCRFVIQGAKLFGVPVTATEQYPQGLGPTVASLAELIAERPNKKRFSAVECTISDQALCEPLPSRAGHLLPVAHVPPWRRQRANQVEPASTG